MSNRKKKIYRIISLYLAFNLLAQICWPTAVFALTNGPGQPEFQSFEPAGTTDMVNLFTGDFNYNIPLMTVPGPNGGYPINLSYHAGISMEQEASWVGLGWNINAGAINRGMRGLPDDFNGEEVIKSLHYKPNTSFGFKFGQSIADRKVTQEIFGFTLPSYIQNGSLDIYYNNYRGMGFGWGFGLSNAQQIANAAGDSHALPFKLNLSSTSDGMGVNLDISQFWNKNKSDNNMSYGWFVKGSLSWGSRDGIRDISLGGGWGYSDNDNKLNSHFINPLGVSFAKSDYLPSSTPEMAGFIEVMGVEIGKDLNGDFKADKITSLNAQKTYTYVKNPNESLLSYGYLYANQSTAVNRNNVLDDLNREKDAPPARQSKTLGIPVATYDVYNVSGQGVGGVFRPYHSDIGIYTEPGIISTIRGKNVLAEAGVQDVTNGSTTSHFGINLAYEQSQTYSGMWYNHFFAGNNGNQGWNSLSDYTFRAVGSGGDLNGDFLYEPFYFKMSGEQTAAPQSQLDFISGEEAVRFKLNEIYGDDNGIAVRPEIATDVLYTDNSVNETGLDLANTLNHRLYRERRIESNQYYTNDQLERFTALEPANIYSTYNSFPATGGTATPSIFDYTVPNGNQIGAFTEVNADGNRYVYGIPVYTSSNKDVVFAHNGLAETPNDFLHNYSNVEASVNNQDPGTDQYFSSSTLPSYATTYLLTAIYSPDYVDLTGNGPTEDDLGYYVKFNYTRDNSNYKWRAPYWGAIVNAGYLSNVNDDKFSYSYGEKQIYLLHSIETKTHVACFSLQSNVRKDGHAAVAENAQDTSTYWSQVSSATGLRALDHISLYSKADPNYGTSSATPLKSVYFTYDYSLCPGIYNNENLHGSGADTGKLTLKSVYFTYLNNSKGQLNPYEFEYIDNSYDVELLNPGYDPLGNDRWGSYKKQIADNRYRNNESPYVDQKTANRSLVDQSSAAWCLKKITLPSGSTITVNYEADDYAYVQDKRATQMCRVVGFGDGSSNDLADVMPLLTTSTNRVYFELNTPIAYGSSADSVYRYIEGIDKLYFKVFMLLKPHYGSTSPAFDYVQGYCKLGTSYGYVDEGSSNSYRFAYVTVNNIDRDDYPVTSGGLQSNPIQKAAWQTIYLERPDLFNNYNLVNGTLANFATAATNMIADIPRAVAPYTTAFAKLWGVFADINVITNNNRECMLRPSYIRLNNPRGVKAGGGHRVKSIIMGDEWSTLSGSTGSNATYGISYTYRLANGKSSGVASYEPMIGGEEIALRKPIRYSSDNLVKQDEAFYVEEPIGESYYPAPVVGYSRVIVRSIVGNNNRDGDNSVISTSRSGQTVYEFYTSKDYPVKCDMTNLDKTWFPIPVFLPFIGAITYNNRGFSQGYSVVLNDMHGKLKSVSTYAYDANLDANPVPVRRVSYKYNGGYDETRPNYLNSTVSVLTDDAYITTAKLGETYDFFTDLRQHSNETLELGAQYNTNINSISGFTLPVLLPLTNISKSLYRSAVVMKVIYRTGILTEVETIDDGARSVAKNLLFDAETGAPLLTSVTNEFERPVYTYNYAGHWTYDGMKGAYNNVGAKFLGKTTSSGVLSINGASSVFFPGDEVMYIPSSGQGEIFTVSAVSGNNVTLVKSDGTSAGTVTGDFIITRSGYRNLQSVSNGTIVSLSDPTTGREFPLFAKLNTLPILNSGTPYEFVDCATGGTIAAELSVTPSYNRIEVLKTGGGCRAFIIFPSIYTVSNNIHDFDGCKFYKNGNTVTVDFPTGPDWIGTWSDPGHCFNECLNDVLHASATRFGDNWTMDFTDVGVSPGTGFNRYKFGELGVWRTESNYLFQIDRKQSNVTGSITDISRDGTYDNFVLYDWESNAVDNPYWSYVSSVSRYSPYGYALESRDALGIFSSTMYGYDNTKQIAATTNCEYFEMANDAFEDYSGSYPASNGHGHLLFSAVGAGSAPTLSSTYAHTGRKSLAVNYNNEARFTTSTTSSSTVPYSTTEQYFKPRPGEKYNITVWARATGGGTPAVQIGDGTNIWTYTPVLSESPIEGWRRIDVSFTAPAASTTLTISLICQGAGTAYFDDLRVQPFSSAMMTYVYDPQTHWLLAELDNRDYATLYNYDEEGTLVQVKQETENGIFTVKTARSNIQH